MIFSQVTLQVETTVKKKNGAEANVIKPIVLPAVKQKISQLRLDEFSMIGLGKNVRYELNGIGEMEDLIFNYFLDEKGNIFNKDPLRIRKLLLHRSEINKMEAKLKEKGLTLVPIKVYFKDSLVKVEIGMARGKKLYDKRQDIAKKDQRREAERDFKVKNLY